ncbi:MAG: hypothetical protein QGH40_01420 [bacterium]|jgi:hypothetical protein|nr:hypothetical protein [bacterium]
MSNSEKIPNRIKEMTPGIPGETPGAGQREIYLHRLEPKDIELIVSRFLARRERCRACSRPGCVNSVVCKADE